MSGPEKPAALRRKLTGPSSPFDQAGMSPAKALRIAIARAAENTAGLQVSVVGFVEEKVTLAQIAESLAGSHLIFSTKGPGGAIGLAILDVQTMSAFVEQLITGRVIPSKALEHKPTPTDAAVVGGVLDAILMALDAELEQIPDLPPVTGFRRTGVFEDERAVSMALDDIEYRSYRLALDLSNGAKNGELRLIFRWEKAGMGASGVTWEKAWRDTVNEAQAPVVAILQRLSLPLSEVTQFEIGTLIPVPVEVIGAVSLEGENNRAVATGRLGQSNGYRAVRVSAAMPNGDVQANLLPFQAPEAQHSVSNPALMGDAGPVHESGPAGQSTAEPEIRQPEDLQGLAVD